MRPTHQPAASRSVGSPSPPAFWHARWQRLSPLARDIVLVLIIKAVVLVALWFAFFRAPAAPQMAMDPQRVEQHVAAPRTNTEPPHAVR
jgi:hypothetical protein